MPDNAWGRVERLLIVRLDNVGDVVMLSPALRAVRAALPTARLTLLATPAGAQVAPLLPWVDDVIVASVVWQDASGSMPFNPERERTLIATIERERFDAALVFTSFSQSPYPPAYACYLAGIPLRAGESKEFGGSVLSDVATPLPDAAHQADRNLHLIEAIGFDAGSGALEIRVPPVVQADADILLHGRGVDPRKPFVVLAPGASCAARRYEPERFAEALRLIAGRRGMPVVVVGSERERELCASIAGQLADIEIASIAGLTTISELAGVISRAMLVVANDSGPMHIADALRRPIVVLYSGTELESQWRPRTAPATVLRRPTACSPCYAFECSFGMECLDIPPAEVADAALQLLDRAPAAPELRVAA